MITLRDGENFLRVEGKIFIRFECGWWFYHNGFRVKDPDIVSDLDEAYTKQKEQGI